MVVRILVRIGGPQGNALQSAERALDVLATHAEITPGSAPLCLPVSAALAHKLVHQEHERACASGSGSQGGVTMGATLHAAFKWLVEHLRLEIDLSESVLNAAAPPPGKRPGSRTAAVAR
jgi:hypothetical protein